MSEASDNLPVLIGQIRKAGSGKSAIGAVTLVNLIPYAGGAIAGLIGDFAARRRTEKICDVLSSLNEKLERHQANPTEHLSEDQVVEVVHETLSAATVASDREKIQALKNGLGYTFIDDDSFERKQVFLKILRDMTKIELLMLSAVYDSSDPYVMHLPRTTPAPSWGTMPDSLRFAMTTSWEPIANQESSGTPALGEYLAREAEVDRAIGDAALRLLDGKGLSAAGPIIDANYLTVFREKNPNLFASALSITPDYTQMYVQTERPKPTPLERARTEFGKQFQRFIEGY